MAQSPTTAPVEWQGGDDEDLSYLRRRIVGTDRRHGAWKAFFKPTDNLLEKKQEFKWITGYYMED